TRVAETGGVRGGGAAGLVEAPRSHQVRGWRAHHLRVVRAVGGGGGRRRDRVRRGAAVGPRRELVCLAAEGLGRGSDQRDGGALDGRARERRGLLLGADVELEARWRGLVGQ